jgi:uncharacterized protein
VPHDGVVPGPVRGSERIHALDIIRGFALLGVLQMNLVFFSGNAYRELADLPFATGPGGEWLIGIRDWLLAGKSIALFSVLFGVGLAIQMERAQARASGLGWFAARRLGALWLLGAAHSILVWNGDILHIYAVGGVLILPFLGRARPISDGRPGPASDARPGPASGGRSILVPLAGAVAVFALGTVRDPIMAWLRLPPQFLWPTWQERALWILGQADQAYGAGTWWQACRWRVWEWWTLGPFYLVHYLLGCLPLFLGGMALWRAGILRDPGAHLRALRLGFHAAFWPGLGLTLAFPAMARLSSAGAGRSGALALALGDLSAYAVALGYLLGILLLLQRPGWRAWLGLLAPMGRMALSNYLAQSMICAWAFNSHGLGLWHQVTPIAYTLGGCLLFALQAAWSRWWLARFRFGPAEWLWRMVSYGRLEPLRIQAGPGQGDG